jgi:GTP-binding protein Era
MPEAEHRSGVAALLGRPNAGKSTLLNRILGEKLAIVTRKPQTTRSRILGIWNGPGAQVLFIDTPGFHEAARPLNRALNTLVAEVADQCDVALLLVDPAGGADAGHAALLARLAARGTPVLGVATQCDRAGRGAVPWPPESLAALPWLRASGVTGEGVDELLAAVVARLPAGPRLYPDDELTDRPLRFLCAEEVREAVFECLDQEVPYGVAVEVQEFDESRPDLVRIRADLLVERASLKGIVLGQGGGMIKRIGSTARPAIESLVGRRVYLELWVKHVPDWPRRANLLKSLGYC